ncbi:hypothetical protein LG943_10045 [Streptomonospora sp. S1-112]|uniref:SUKH-4 immunity protein n=1 Tax=Streptomonospora mangrovi TaxID=2883123 RepID=A0A9X3NQ46_9ACTN|nr:hypothetical protein [Streptomonospora mangrovi]MDA0564665.1 hypothetical protein [Streptomonospora mangrovi]
MAFPYDPEQPVPDPLTPEAAARVLAERRQSLPAWIEASRDSVVYLGDLSRWDPPETLLHHPSHGLTHMSTICELEDLTPFTMMGYDPFDVLLTNYCAEYMFSDVGGTWVLDEDPESPTFGRFLIGGFSADRPEATVDVYAAVTAFLAEPEGRELETLLESLQEAMGAPVGVTDTSFP